MRPGLLHANAKTNTKTNTNTKTKTNTNTKTASQFPPTTFQRPWAPVVKCQLSEALPVAHANVKTNTNMTTYDIVKAENEIPIGFSNR